MLFCLIVDDEKWIRSGIASRVNECAGFAEAGTAANGEEALKWLEGGHADILITDVRMPHMDGLELVKRVNERFPWMKSILISSYDDFEFAKRGISLGTIEYIVKPVRRSDLEEALRSAASQLQALRRNEARALLLRHYNAGNPLMAKWRDYAANQLTVSLPLLVIDTFALLESWAGVRVDLLAALADEWITGVAAATKTDGLCESLAEQVTGSPVPVLDDRKLYFRLTAVYRLELAANRLSRQRAKTGISSGRRAVADVKRYIESHYKGKLSLQQIADAVHVSKPYLANVFRQETGMTIWAYLIEVRMRRAKDLMFTTDKKLSEVANEIGYSDSAHFAKVFKTYYGMNSTELKSRFFATNADK